MAEYCAECGTSKYARTPAQVEQAEVMAEYDIIAERLNRSLESATKE